MTHRLTLSVLAVACLAAHAAVAAPPAFTDLGVDNAVQAVSDDGTVVVGLALNYTDAQASGVTRWTPATGTRGIGGLTVGHPDVSADGATIAGTILTDRSEAAFWTESGGWKALGQFDLIPPMPGWETTTNAMSANGQRLAGFTVPPPVDYGHLRAFSFNPDTFVDRWADYGWQELPLARKGSFAEASGISDDGLTQVGISTDIGGAFRAVRWVDGRLSELFDQHGDRLGGESVHCNRRCDVVVGGGGGSSAVHPVLAWRLLSTSRAPACYLKPLSGPVLPALRYYAYDTSETGNIVTGSYYYDDVPPGGGFVRNVAKGFLWIGDANGGTMHDLATYLHSLGQRGLDGWQNVVATGVSADGRFLVGWGQDAQGVTRGWRVAFGSVPVATGPAADRTICPRAFSVRPRPPVAAGRASFDVDAYRDAPSGEFRARGQRAYRVETRGARVYGGIDQAHLAPLLSLGGDLYYDRAARRFRSFVRDGNGLIVGMSEAGTRGQRVDLLRADR